MPQMSPMWWDIMFILFIMNFMIINMIMYWNNKKMMKLLKMNMKMNNMNWKW